MITSDFTERLPPSRPSPSPTDALREVEDVVRIVLPFDLDEAGEVLAVVGLERVFELRIREVLVRAVARILAHRAVELVLPGDEPVHRLLRCPGAVEGLE